ncbi:Transposase domain protein [Rickettsiales endosymbiont of Paramecium tredecaurelia]|uniref:IS630 transposase-related protein n=1 Tax=Candidatus Sarmatiella mevalonica TaxID=2770581 RepID=UPI001924A7AB|nr:Transposase domain protein [Candidatus Sarmatiella mevalonica]
MKGKMTKSYSNDLREKVVEYLEAGNSYDQASKLFKISVIMDNASFHKSKKTKELIRPLS